MLLVRLQYGYFLHILGDCSKLFESAIVDFSSRDKESLIALLSKSSLAYSFLLETVACSLTVSSKRYDHFMSPLNAFEIHFVGFHLKRTIHLFEIFVAFGDALRKLIP